VEELQAGSMVVFKTTINCVINQKKLMVKLFSFYRTYFGLLKKPIAFYNRAGTVPAKT
jgi:hypothetical protein